MIYDVIIIGAGPAGTASGIYCARKKLKTLVLTKDFVGQVGKTSQIDNWPGEMGISGQELMKKFTSHLKEFANLPEKEKDLFVKENREVKVVKKEKEGFSVETDNREKFQSRVIIVATGRDPRPLEVPGEKELISKGVSYCPICDAPFFKDKGVAVIGGGNSGLEAALDLTRYAKRIFILERSNKLIGDEFLQEKAKKKNKIQIHLSKEVKEIIGKEKVQALSYRDTETGKEFQVPVEGVFVQIGSIPATGFLHKLVEFNKEDEIGVDFQSCGTSCSGIFAAGDVNNGKWKQIVIAAGEGARAALAAYDYLENSRA